MGASMYIKSICSDWAGSVPMDGNRYDYLERKTGESILAGKGASHR